MSTTKHTPGPWRVSTANPLQVNTDKGGDSVGVAESQKYNAPNTFCDPNEAEANAKLIAAAPELLEALDGLLLTVGMTAFKHEGQRAVLQEACDIARAAIAKATL